MVQNLKAIADSYKRFKPKQNIAGALLVGIATVITGIYLSKYPPFYRFGIQFVVITVFAAIYYRLAIARAFSNEIARQQELIAEKRKTEFVLANLTDGVIAVTRDRNVLLANTSAYDLLGMQQETDGSVLLTPEISRIVRECFDQGNVVINELKLHSIPPKILELTGSPVIDKTYGFDYTIISIKDLTETRNMEQRQRDFVSNVSHELKTPLTAIRTSAETLINGAKNDDQVVDRFLNNMVEGCDRLARFIDDMMQMARMESGVIPLKRRRVNINALLKRSIDSVSAPISERRIKITVNSEPDLMWYLDENQLMHAVRNLVDNAVKYNNPGGWVTITAKKCADELRISVEDGGVGIPRSDLPLIFNRFHRVDKARSTQVVGTGLGLSIVKSVAQIHGGNVEVQSVLGKGSTFTITIPAMEDDQDEDSI